MSDAAATAVAAARAAGLEVDRSELVDEGWNALVRLDLAGGGRAAARLAAISARFRDPARNLGGEAALSAALAEGGAPVARPLHPEPIRVGDDPVTLWEWLDVQPRTEDAPAAAAALRRCHDALLEVDAPASEPWGLLDEARRWASTAPEGLAPRIVAAGEAIDARLAALDPPVRPVHGDAHPNNLVWTDGGPLWVDWEDAQLAPLEWDLATLVFRARVHGGDDRGPAILAAYGTEPDPDVLDVCVAARAFQVVALIAHLLDNGPHVRPELAARLAWLERWAAERPR